MSNAALKQHTLDDFIYSLDEIQYSNEDQSKIYEVQHFANSVGYISLENLKILNAENNTNWNDYTFRNFNETQFKSLFEITAFQRRKPQLLATDNFNDTDDEFYLLIKGQKSGPFTMAEIRNHVEKKEILLNDLVSTNAGHSWVKIYQLDGFDRRTLKASDSLPGLPSEDLFEGAAGSTNKETDEMDAITGLAYLGNIKRGKAIEREREDNLEEAIKKSSSQGTFYRMIFIASLIGIVYMGYSLKSSLKSPFSGDNSENRIGEQNSSDVQETGPITEDKQPNMLKPSRTFNSINQNNGDSFSRGPKFETKKLNPVRPARNFNRSFTESKNFQDQVNAPAPTGEESTYYYNDSAPLELDPVRTQVSKETADPEGLPSQSSDPLFNQEVEN